MRLVPLLLALLGLAAAEAQQFAEQELALDSPGLARLAGLGDDQIHDAYDADDDGRWARVSVECSHAASGEHLLVPAFALRESPGGPWRWRLRWQPGRPGVWELALTVRGGLSASAAAIDERLALGSCAVAPSSRRGPLAAPGPGENPRYLRERRADGSSRATWLFGACRAWVVASDPAGTGWAPEEGCDRDGWLLPLLRGHGYDLLNQWAAPWEYLAVHRDRAEWWRQADGTWRRHPVPEAGWAPWACFDQGRCAALDRWARLCAGDGLRPLRWLYAPLPHQCLQTRDHSWGVQESGWSVEDDGGRQGAEKLNGFSALAASPWELLAADPRARRGSKARRLFDHQAAFWRYQVARWGASPALGIWVLVDELDAVGDRAGSMALGSGWWAHPACERWLSDTADLLRCRLPLAEGGLYDGDPLRHPLHAATTSFGGQLLPGANLEWDGPARPELHGWHWYPTWQGRISWRQLWDYAVAGVERYAQSGTTARLISETGILERSAPEAAPQPFQPTLYHVTAWASVFAGLAGPALDWDDGKEFGEPAPRGTGAFAPNRYPVDNAAHLARLREVLAPLDPETLTPARPPAPVQASGTGGCRILALWEAPAGRLHGWLLRGPDGTATGDITGLTAGAWELTWIDPWPGGGELPAEILDTGPDGRLRLDAGPALERLHGAAPAFPAGGDRRDLAFRLRRRPGG